MPRQQKHYILSPVGIFLCVLGSVYLVYLVALAHSWYPALFTPTQTIVEHPVNASASVIMQHWSPASMRSAIDADQQFSTTPSLTQGSSTDSVVRATRQRGQSPRTGNAAYPLSTVGRIFFNNEAGQDVSCSGTAVISTNRSTVDTAGHCLYWRGGWSRNLIFCPLYDNGNTPYGCWAARDLEVPADWLDAMPNDLHHDLGMAIVSPNSQGLLTDMVGGAGWAYNQSINQPFYAYGYPAGYPFDGQTRQSCADGSVGKSWQHAGGRVISIPCNMTGGSSGGPWFIKIGGNWYLNGHNDFTSSIQPDHMFSPYYDDTWYALYDKARHT